MYRWCYYNAHHFQDTSTSSKTNTAQPESKHIRIFLYIEISRNITHTNSPPTELTTPSQRNPNQQIQKLKAKRKKDSAERF